MVLNVSPMFRPSIRRAKTIDSARQEKKRRAVQSKRKMQSKRKKINGEEVEKTSRSTTQSILEWTDAKTTNYMVSTNAKHRHMTTTDQTTQS